MTLRRTSITVTTAADGTATAYLGPLSGYLSSIHYVKDDFTDGVDFTITAEATGETLWTEANVNASAVKRPLGDAHTTAGVAKLYAAGGTAVGVPIALSRDRIKIVIASGGNATSGTFIAVLDDGR